MPLSTVDAVSTTLVNDALIFVRASLECSGVAFTWLGSASGDPIKSGVGQGMFEDYPPYQQDDPLNIERLLLNRKTIASLVIERAGVPTDSHIRYDRYLHKYAVVDEVDFIFRLGDQPFGLIAALRRENDPMFSSLNKFEALQRYLQSSLSRLPCLRPVVVKARLGQQYGLTSRELAVTELILEGAPNKAIAQALNIEAATVKTHTLHIFAKLNVKTRAAVGAVVAAI
ncbi:LuxR C-terminal-related transcriptional regulator [Pseudomonas sp. 32A]|uniref:LuxR C-terminal-related transcriptional regulator n=1 Tax=Pseudomonas sp. 32A TaxID=651185 RepID=UPI0040467DDB